MVKRSFELCNISLSDALKVRIRSFYQQCMEKARGILEADVQESKDHSFLMIVED